jgi:hypothetical protein
VAEAAAGPVASARPLRERDVQQVARAGALHAHAFPQRWRVMPCADCGEVVSVPAAVAARKPFATCHGCARRVCCGCGAMVTASRHEGRACGEVQAELLAAAKRGADGIAGVRACPGCGAGITKPRDHHCHHIKCSQCRTDFCFECRVVLTPKQLTACPNNCPLFCKSPRDSTNPCHCVECTDCGGGRPPCKDCDGACGPCRRAREGRAEA